MAETNAGPAEAAFRDGFKTAAVHDWSKAREDEAWFYSRTREAGSRAPAETRETDRLHLLRDQSARRFGSYTHDDVAYLIQLVDAGVVARSADAGREPR